MPSILFVCTGNLYRSPLAAAFFARRLQHGSSSGHWVVESAGTWAVPGQCVPAELLEAARRLGIDLRRHVTRQVDHDLLARYDLIFVMEKGQREAINFEFPCVQRKVHLLSEVADQLQYDVADPLSSGLGLDETVQHISGLIDRAYPRICHLAQACDRSGT